jgi:hypothetical protein
MKAEAEHTIIGSYSIIKSVTGGSTDTFPTAFPFGVTSGDWNLLEAKYGGVADETRAYRTEIIITSKPAGTGVIQFTGAAPKGCEEPICSLAISSAADIVETGDWRVVDTITITNWHLAEDNILVTDSGNSHPCKVGWDNIGYQWLKAYVTSLTTITDIRIYARIL